MELKNYRTLPFDGPKDLFTNRKLIIRALPIVIQVPHL